MRFGANVETMPSTEPRNALPDGWIDRLFQRFSVLYGKHWADMWEGVPLADVKDAWATELHDVTGQQIIFALGKCGKFPPTLPEFVALCKPAPVPAAHRLFLPSPRPARVEIDARVKAEIDRYLKRGQTRDPKDWAREILSLAEQGEYRQPYGIQCAKEALGLAP